VTFGFYYPAWFLVRRAALNSLDSPRKLHRWPFITNVIVFLVTRQLASVTPTNGAGRTSWDVSPDGHTIAFCEFAWDGGNRITLVTAGTGDTRVVDVKDFKNIADMAWASDGRSLFATTATIHGGELLRVMLDGRTVLLRRFQSQELFAPRPSPDGRSLLVGVQQSNSNAWVIDR